MRRLRQDEIETERAATDALIQFAEARGISKTLIGATLYGYIAALIEGRPDEFLGPCEDYSRAALERLQKQAEAMRN